MIRGVFHEEPPDNYDEFLQRYAEALYYMEYLGQSVAFAVYGKNG